MTGQPLRLQLRASPVLTLLTVGMHAAAAAILWAFLPAAAGIGAAALLAGLATLTVRERTMLRAAAAPSLLELKQDGGLSVRLHDGSEIAGQPAPRRYVSRWLVVIELIRPAGGQRTILVARDMLPAGEFRHLRLWALWKALPAVTAAEGA